MSAVLLRYNEIALKGGNRTFFEKCLGRNTLELVRREASTGARIRHHYGRMVLELAETERTPPVLDAIQRTFGITSFSTTRECPSRFEDIVSLATEEFDRYVLKNGLPTTFRIRTRRSDKVVEQNSMAIDRHIGTLVQHKYPSAGVDLIRAKMTLGIEIRKRCTYVWTDSIPGLGGLPVGSNAKVLTLISGGLDSPIAAMKVLKRGSQTAFLHFHGRPFVGEDVLNKVEELVRTIGRYNPTEQTLYIIPFGKIQESIALRSFPKLRTLLYRRLMIRIANRVAEMAGARALVTGESLGQVASQTVENIGVIDSVTNLPILRPLITYDKDEIVDLARKFGTFDISIQPGIDCCTLFADRHPAIRSYEGELLEQEAKLPMNEFIDQALAGLEKKIIRA